VITVIYLAWNIPCQCIVMQENSSGIIVFRTVLGQRLYLLLHYHYKGDYWDFPRGNIREPETPRMAAIRETEEETGLSANQLRIVEGFEENVKWFYRLNEKTVHKQVTYFLAETENEDVKISEEHVGARWLSFEDALSLLKYRNSKKLLKKAENYLRKLEEL
jgi:8-oxo-dGTP pyrophosphatase MutT (NUDIX family)